MTQRRLFVAIPLDDDLRSRLEQAQNNLARSNADLRWTRPGSIHLTLKFLGDTHERLVPDISAELEQCVAAHRGRTLRVKGLGAFPDLRRPRVIWAGLEGDLDALCAVQRDVEQRLARLGFEPERRGFSPHLTLGRVRSPRRLGELIKAVEAGSQADLGVLEARRIVLYQSQLLPGGARYTCLARYKMA
ncbi:MAG: RNA 2',3'-cyclic phosphodiesterase [Candidatus Alcyoniella australis]|nr:RNA 2',3'-cyclic phosphodiesterase [Candidatus Alcyoniella australis]